MFFFSKGPVPQHPFHPALTHNDGVLVRAEVHHEDAARVPGGAPGAEGPGGVQGPVAGAAWAGHCGVLCVRNHHPHATDDGGRQGGALEPQAADGQGQGGGHHPDPGGHGQGPDGAEREGGTVPLLEVEDVPILRRVARRAQQEDGRQRGPADPDEVSSEGSAHPPGMTPRWHMRLCHRPDGGPVSPRNTPTVGAEESRRRS